ncbi:MAG TPA: MBL fold metallo-hydrolase [Planctomycetaceae bacterium]|nr:MBL fold metallo-hydrolase [Planctomycetaceae bacterium]
MENRTAFLHPTIMPSSDDLTVDHQDGTDRNTPFGEPFSSLFDERRRSSRYNAPMKMIALQSGSNGNCIYVEANGFRLLFYAGISRKQADQRLAAHGRDIRDVDALINSHEHCDHSHAMGIFQ